MEQTRPETGPMEFGKDWPGIFIRGDCCFAYTMSLNQAIEALKDPADAMTKMYLQSLLNLLGGCITMNQKFDEKLVQKLKPFNECIEEVK